MPFGELLGVTGLAANDNDTGFTGHVQDAGSGLTYMQARYYDPAIGRFLGEDPVGFVDSMKGPAFIGRYGYTDGHPINAYDPSSRDFLYR